MLVCLPSLTDYEVASHVVSMAAAISLLVSAATLSLLHLSGRWQHQPASCKPLLCVSTVQCVLDTIAAGMLLTATWCQLQPAYWTASAALIPAITAAILQPAAALVHNNNSNHEQQHNTPLSNILETVRQHRRRYHVNGYHSNATIGRGSRSTNSGQCERFDLRVIVAIAVCCVTVVLVVTVCAVFIRYTTDRGGVRYTNTVGGSDRGGASQTINNHTGVLSNPALGVTRPPLDSNGDSHSAIQPRSRINDKRIKWAIDGSGNTGKPAFGNVPDVPFNTDPNMIINGWLPNSIHPSNTAIETPSMTGQNTATANQVPSISKPNTVSANEATALQHGGPHNSVNNILEHENQGSKPTGDKNETPQTVIVKVSGPDKMTSTISEVQTPAMSRWLQRMRMARTSPLQYTLNSIELELIGGGEQYAGMVPHITQHSTSQTSNSVLTKPQHNTQRPISNTHKSTSSIAKPRASIEQDIPVSSPNHQHTRQVESSANSVRLTVREHWIVTFSIDMITSQQQQEIHTSELKHTREEKRHHTTASHLPTQQRSSHVDRDELSIQSRISSSATITTASTQQELICDTSVWQLVLTLTVMLATGHLAALCRIQQRRSVDHVISSAECCTNQRLSLTLLIASLCIQTPILIAYSILLGANAIWADKLGTSDSDGQQMVLVSLRPQLATALFCMSAAFPALRLCFYARASLSRALPDQLQQQQRAKINNEMQLPNVV